MSKWDNASSVLNDIYNEFKFRDAFLERWNMRDLATKSADDLNFRQSTSWEYPKDMPNHIRNLVTPVYQDWIPMYFWSKYKCIYAPHPTLTDEMIFTSTSDVINGAVLHQFPHPNPLFVFPSGTPITHIDGKPGLVRGFVVVGAVKYSSTEGVHLVSADSNVEPNCLAVMVISDVLDDHGNVLDIDTCHLSIRFRDRFTVDDLVNDIMKRFEIGMGNPSLQPLMRTAADTVNREMTVGYVRSLASVVIPHMLYAVSRSADFDRPRKATNAQRVKGMKTSESYRRLPSMQLIPVGYRIGPVLARARREADQRNRGSVNSGEGDRTVRPHLRRAHFHTFRYGPEKKYSYLDWLSPIPVKLFGTKTVPTIHEYQ